MEHQEDRNRIDRLHELAGELDRLLEEHDRLFRDVRERAENLAESPLTAGIGIGAKPRKTPSR